MSSYYDEPELAGYEPGSHRPLRSARTLLVMRILVIAGIAALVLPGIITTYSLASSTAQSACVAWVKYEAPDATGSSATFELWGTAGMGWQCYSEGAFGGDRLVASLGLIPVAPSLAPVPGSNS